MVQPLDDLTPRQIVARLDEYIVGQAAAKRAVAIALRNRYRRQQLPEDQREDVMPKNILMIGPTGVGKTEIARRLAQLARAPFVKVEATKFTEVGYVGRDVESMVRELVATAVRLVEKELFDQIRDEAEARTLDRLIYLIESELPTPVYEDEEEDDEVEDAAEAEEPTEPTPEQEDGFNLATIGAFSAFGFSAPTTSKSYARAEERAEAWRKQIRGELLAGLHETLVVGVDIEEAHNPFLQVFTPQGIEEMGIDTNQMGGAFGTRHTTRRMSVRDARDMIRQKESREMVDRGTVHAEAIKRSEQTGIIFIDEIDKIAGKTNGTGPDVSREGVQRDLLPIIEGSTVATKFGPVKTDHILFIAAGAFHLSKPSDLIPELQGRLPIRVVLESLSDSDFQRILSEPKSALTRQYEQLLATDGVTVSFTPDALVELARSAGELNARTENIGARRLHTMMEKLLEDILFEAPEIEQKEQIFDGARVREVLGDLLARAERGVL